MKRNRYIKLDPKEMDRLQRNAMMDMNWLSGSTGHRKLSLSEPPSKVLANVKMIIVQSNAKAY